jgi:hypothetical protein
VNAIVGDNIRLNMDVNAQKEQFSTAFLYAVSAVAGCALSKPLPDDDSVDWTLSKRLPRRPRLDVQIKCTAGDDWKGDHISFPLKRKNYDDLILTNLISPRALIVVTVPDDISEWILLDSQELALRHCAHWVSLAGSAPTTNMTSVTVRIPRENVFSSDALTRIMDSINDNGRVL